MDDGFRPSRGLLALTLSCLVPVRHVAWGGSSESCHTTCRERRVMVWLRYLVPTCGKCQSVNRGNRQGWDSAGYGQCGNATWVSCWPAFGRADKLRRTGRSRAWSTHRVRQQGLQGILL